MHKPAICIQLRRFRFLYEKFIFHSVIMATFSIDADIRMNDQKPSELRSERRVPGVVYGKTQDPITFSLDASDFLRLYRKAGESSIINLKVGKEDLEVLVHQTQKHPVTGEFTHVDFYAITRGEKVTTKVSIELIGDAPAVKEGAIVEESTREVELKCLPRHLVDHFEIDISVLKEAGDVIRVSDLNLNPEEYELITSEEAVIASATLPRAVVAEEDEEAVEGEEGAEGETAE